MPGRPDPPPRPGGLGGRDRLFDQSEVIAAAPAVGIARVELDPPVARRLVQPRRLPPIRGAGRRVGPAPIVLHRGQRPRRRLQHRPLVVLAGDGHGQHHRGPTPRSPPRRPGPRPARPWPGDGCRPTPPARSGSGPATRPDTAPASIPARRPGSGAGRGTTRCPGRRGRGSCRTSRGSRPPARARARPGPRTPRATRCRTWMRSS